MKPEIDLTLEELEQKYDELKEKLSDPSLSPEEKREAIKAYIKDHINTAEELAAKDPKIDNPSWYVQFLSQNVDGGIQNGLQGLLDKKKEILADMNAGVGDVSYQMDVIPDLDSFESGGGENLLVDVTVDQPLDIDRPETAQAFKV